MSYGGFPYGGVGYAGADVADIPDTQTQTTLAVEVAFTTDALETPVWNDITADVRSWDTARGRNRELERFQPGRATVVLGNLSRQYDSAAGLPSQYVDLPGTAGNYASIPDSAAVSITGDIDIRVKVALDDWTPATTQDLCTKFGADGNRSWDYKIVAAGTEQFTWSANGSTLITATSTVATGVADGTTKWVRVTLDVDNGAAGNDAKFYTSDDGVTWAQLGTTVTTATATSIFDSTAQVEIGAATNLNRFVTGNVYYAEVRNGINGPVVAKFDANTVPQTGTRTPSSWTSETGETWTVNGSAWAWGGTWGSIWSGNIRPGRRMRIRETFNGVTYPIFDGYVDRWQLDYPGVGKDATATLTATDGFKLFARTDLDRSVYWDVVDDDDPEIWWLFDETKTAGQDSALRALNSGTLGSTADGTYVGPPELGAQGLIVKDPGSSMRTNKVETATPDNGVKLLGGTFDLHGGGTGSFVVEGTLLPEFAGLASIYLASTGPTNDGMFLYHVGLSVWFQVKTGGSGGTVYSVSQAGHPPLERVHIVARYKNGDPLRLWVNGVLTSGDTPAGSVTAALDLQAGYQPGATAEGWSASVGPVAIWRGTAAEAVDQTWVDRHYAAATAPWNGDLPGARIGRALDEAAWPSTLRELDAGTDAFQSATIEGQSVLEHCQKASASERISLLFMSRSGQVRFVGRTAVLARVPYVPAFSDGGAGEVGYRAFTPDDGDQVIRNRAVISRLDGVARVAEDIASRDEYGRFDHILEGLLHNTEAISQAYADFVVAEYKSPRRRITSLTVGPPAVGTEATVYPAMLGRELGDAITVQHTPLAIGAEFSQACAIEGIRHSGAPGGARICTWTLSPEYTTV